MDSESTDNKFSRPSYVPLILCVNAKQCISKPGSCPSGAKEAGRVILATTANLHTLTFSACRDVSQSFLMAVVVFTLRRI